MYVTCDPASLALASRSDQRESERDHINKISYYATTYFSLPMPHNSLLRIGNIHILKP